ncbi:MAG: hypothetical protein AMJ70_01810 [Dehalococcoidia bacterium SG8_51_3]|nr:MAG: hypothetical protein AMJ70_01810 [Dehalococcoidia bacterium SG8_51_3]
MVKTLRITTFIAAILAVGVLAFPVVYGDWGDEEIEKFLSSPGAIERFKEAKGNKKRPGNQVSPLVRQAGVFGLYLNPPQHAPIPKPAQTPVVRTQAPVIPGPRGPVSPKFTLIGTSYYASRPELSLAYIDEPGKGLYWVRQGDRVSHLLIQEVKDGSVIVQDHDRLDTLVVARAPKKSLLKNDETSKSTSVMPGLSSTITSTASVQTSVIPTLPTPTPSAADRAIAAKSAAAAAAPPRTVQTRAVSGVPEMSEAEQDAVLADFIKDLKAMQESGDQSEEEKAALQEAIVDFEAMRITTNEARRLDRLGKELRGVQNDPERAKNLKIQKSGVSQPPPPPPSSKRTVPPRRLPPRRPPR